MKQTEAAESKSKTITVKFGNAIVKIYPVKNRDRIIYTVTHLDQTGRRVRQNFATLPAAKTEAQVIATRIHNGELEVLKLSSTDRGIYLESLAALKPIGKRIDLVAKEYVEAFKILDGQASISQAAEFYKRHNIQKLSKMPVQQVVDEFISNKTADGRSPRYLEDCRNRLDKFAGHFKAREMGGITSQELEDWLRGLKGSSRTRNNFRALVVTLFHFARKRGLFLKNEPTPADELEKAKDAGSPIGIFTAAQFVKLIDKASDEIIPFITISAFAGLRRAELLRLDWEEIKFDQGHVEVKAAKAKTAQRRIIPIQPNLEKWLLPYRKSQGAVCRSDRVPDAAAELAKKHGIGWPNNVLRHSFASYRLAICKSAPQVALEMGNSPSKIFTNYREVVTETEAIKWFSIAPEE